MGRNTAMRFAKEEVELVEFSDAMLDRLAREFAPLKDKSISVQQANKLRMIFNKIPDRFLDALRRKKYLSYLPHYLVWFKKYAC